MFEFVAILGFVSVGVLGYQNYQKSKRIQSLESRFTDQDLSDGAETIREDIDSVDTLNQIEGKAIKVSKEMMQQLEALKNIKNTYSKQATKLNKKENETDPQTKGNELILEKKKKDNEDGYTGAF